MIKTKQVPYLRDTFLCHNSSGEIHRFLPAISHKVIDESCLHDQTAFIFGSRILSGGIYERTIKADSLPVKKTGEGCSPPDYVGTQ